MISFVNFNYTIFNLIIPMHIVINFCLLIKTNTSIHISIIICFKQEFRHQKRTSNKKFSKLLLN